MVVYNVLMSICRPALWHHGAAGEGPQVRGRVHEGRGHICVLDTAAIQVSEDPRPDPQVHLSVPRGGDGRQFREETYLYLWYRLYRTVHTVYCA